MRFDTVIIGGGLAGLICGIHLSKRGQRCAIISSGQSALHFSSGSLDLLGTLPNSENVESPVEALTALVEQAPNHPYSRFNAERFVTLANKGAELLREAGIDIIGSAEKNHYRLTPTGAMKPTWLTFGGYVHSASPEELEWKSVALFNAEGFLDFYPQFLADEMRRKGTKCNVHTFNLPELEILRQNPTEMRSANIARIFDNKATLTELANQIASRIGDEQAVLLPAFMGINSQGNLKYLMHRLNRPVAVVTTLPPSVPGLQVQTLLRRYFQELGGIYMLGDTAIGYQATQDQISALYTRNHGDIALKADNYVLATGSFFSGGLVATNTEVYEPLFKVDVCYDSSREKWYDRDLFKAQGYEHFGVATTPTFNAQRAGQPIENLYAAGAALAGFNAVKQGCGAGVSILTAIEVAEQILSKM